MCQYAGKATADQKLYPVGLRVNTNSVQTDG